MDDVTKRVVEAAGAWFDYLVARGKRNEVVDPAEELADAVEAYRKANRPLVERMADLKPGAVVLTKDNATRTLLLNHPKSQKYAYERHGDLCLSEYSWVSVIVSEGPDQ